MRHHGTDGLGWGATTALALGLAVMLPMTPAVRSAALLGLALSASAGGLAAVLIGWAHRRTGLGGALVAIGVPFALRVLLLVAGLVTVSGEWLAFTGAFFGVFFAQLALEILLVVSPPRQRRAPQA